MEGCPKSAGNVTGSGLNQQTLSYFQTPTTCKLNADLALSKRSVQMTSLAMRSLSPTVTKSRHGIAKIPKEQENNQQEGAQQQFAVC